MKAPNLDVVTGEELNLYQYSRNNPGKYVDPTGEIAWVPILLVAIPIIEGAADLVQLGVALYQATNNPTPSNIAGVGACAVDVVSPPGTPGSVLAEMNTARPKGTKTYQTYTKTNSKTGSDSKGSQNRQQRLKDLLKDDKVPSADKGWIKQEMNEVAAGKKRHLRNPPGKDLAHERGREAKKGYGYEHAHLQNKKDHRTQHKLDNWGKKNKERPVQ